VCSAALGLREERRLRARLPLRRLTVAGEGVGDLAPMTHLVRDEVNVKEVVLTEDLDAVGSFALRPNAKVLGPRLGRDVQAVIAAAKAGDWEAGDDGTVTVAGHELAPGEFELALQPHEGAAAAPLPGNDAVVELDVEVTPELAAEGMARDVVRLVQQARKDEGLEVTDRIRCHIDSTAEVVEALEAHRRWVADAVLARELSLAEGVDDDALASVDGHPVSISVERA
jgi:isoleucyl-tRNA synthetase